MTHSSCSCSCVELQMTCLNVFVCRLGCFPSTCEESTKKRVELPAMVLQEVQHPHISRIIRWRCMYVLKVKLLLSFDYESAQRAACHFFSRGGGLVHDVGAAGYRHMFPASSLYEYAYHAVMLADCFSQQHLKLARARPLDSEGVLIVLRRVSSILKDLKSSENKRPSRVFLWDLVGPERGVASEPNRFLDGIRDLLDSVLAEFSIFLTQS